MRKIVIALMLTFLSFGCAPNNDVVKSYGMSFNPERVKRGIRTIKDDDLLAYKYEYITPIWVDKKRHASGNTHIAQWVSKQLEIRDGSIVTETDTYLSGISYPTASEGVQEEELFVRYNYENAKAGTNPWWCKIFWGPRRGEYSLEQADAILKDWGISRL